MVSWTRSREPALQDWPALLKIDHTALGRAASMLASSKTMSADLPPHSRLTFLRFDDAISMIFLPVSVEPVKDTLSTRGLFTSSEPTESPGPVTAFTTPAGIESRDARSPMNSIEIPEVYPAGLMTTVHPAAKAGPSFQDSREIGEFQGTMRPQT